MATVQVELTDTFDQWRQKTNDVSNVVGDSSLLETTSTNLVEAVNEVKNTGNEFSISMSIALG